MNQIPVCNNIPKRILIVDDFKEAALTFQRGFELLTDFQVRIATTSQQALLYCQQQPFDLLITEYKIPNIDGLTLAAWVQYLHPETTVIIVTGLGNIPSLQQTNDVSIYTVMSKPIAFTELCHVAAKAVQAADMVRVNSCFY